MASPKPIAINPIPQLDGHANKKTVDSYSNLPQTVSWFIQLLQEVHNKVKQLSQSQQNPNLLEIENQLVFILVEMTTFSTQISRDSDFYQMLNGLNCHFDSGNRRS
jgi:predicted oxidoreductase